MSGRISDRYASFFKCDVMDYYCRERNFLYSFFFSFSIMACISANFQICFADMFRGITCFEMCTGNIHVSLSLRDLLKQRHGISLRSHEFGLREK
ncbi:uncharacterized protein LY89DRAFT_467631 [Mollisia scopiformis]|uniref:Uncharacterized protein n=1 Tax=Mollisia scopiformis TaxID=149040 RepID=A0A194XJL9_MOLSC|nr:uncharacterized protein LY89DRAFT_467631 [Mollisia scopiformis]KUJ19972.1 hypothetical protein LY89DRAFT_467631 [Mollisia scopiformis]